MRVLEKEIASSYSMGKKNKHKLRKTKDNDASDSSEEVSSKGCVHVNKAVNFNAMKKGLAKQSFGECAGCAKDVVRKGEPKTLIDHLEGATSSDYNEDINTTIWVCLQCGHQGCCRMSQEKHALKHYETPRSSQHNVVINTSTWSAWCYECDNELLPEKYKKVAECMEHIKKQASVPAIDTIQGKNSNGGGGPSVDSSVNKSRPLSAKTTSAGCNKVKGLSNLGNTCFFNAVMQNLVQTYNLESLLGERRKGHPLKLQGHTYYDPDSCSSSDEGDNDRNQKNTTKDLTCIEVSTSDPGPLTHALVVFLHDINTTSRSGCINPSALFGQVCKKAPRFKGMQQQDSHELLRYLMDNMKTEEIKRGQSGVLKYFKLSENTNPKKVDEDTKYKVKAYGHEIKHTFVECLFGGQLISTVVCEECRYISQILEPFLDLSLPVTEEKPQRPNQLHGGRKKEGIGGEVKEEPNSLDAGSHAVKDDKVSKHQAKKQKKRQKRDSRRKNTPSSADVEKEGEDREEENEKDGQDGEKNEHADDDSDADVEDNLESDTSRCYKSLSDSVIPSLESLEKSVEGLALSSINICTNGEVGQVNIASYTVEATSNSFNVKTTIENHSKISNEQLECSESQLAHSNLNEPIKSEFTEHQRHADLTVSYTFTNGHLSENPSASSEHVVENGVDTSVIISCNSVINDTVPMCNGDVRNSSDSAHLVSDVSGVSCANTPHLLNGGVEVETDIVIDNMDRPVNGAVSPDLAQEASSRDFATEAGSANLAKEASGQNPATEVMSPDLVREASVTDLSTEVSTLSLGDSTSTLASDLSRLTLKEDEKDAATGETKDEEHGVTSHTGNKMCNGQNQNLPNGDISDNVQPCKASFLQNSKQLRMKELHRDGKKKSVNTLADRYHPSSGECSIQSCLHQFTAAELLTGNNKFGCKNCTKLKYKNNPNKEKKETVYSNANKQYLIFQPPAVLTLHLKRFEQVGFSSRKVNRHVDFPFVLDIAPYCSSLSQGIKHGQKKILYSLYGVVEHSGRLTSGHYTAYVKVRPNIGTLNNFLNKHNVTLKEYLNTYAQNVLNGDLHSADTADGVNTEGLVPPGRWYHISDSRVNEVTEASVERAQAYLLFYERIY